MLVFPHDSQKVDKYITFYFKDYYKWTLIQFVRIFGARNPSVKNNICHYAMSAVSLHTSHADYFN